MSRRMKSRIAKSKVQRTILSKAVASGVKLTKKDVSHVGRPKYQPGDKVVIGETEYMCDRNGSLRRTDSSWMKKKLEPGIDTK